MQPRWTFLQATAAERHAFRNLEQLRACPNAPAAPENRHRHVLRLESELGTYYLKEFTHTLWKNRLRNLCSGPRSWLDAEREARVTQWLLARAIPAPRPVLWGSEAGRSWYVCAALAGRSLVDWQRAGGLSREELDSAARFLGRALGQGAWLPDASPEHVFLDREQPLASGLRFLLLDFHNGVCGRAPDKRLLSRVLRRFQHAAQELCIPRAVAMRFAAGLLRAAGAGARLRAQLGALAPYDTHGRYEVRGRSSRYRQRNLKRAAREQSLLDAVWIGRPGERVLDAPTGTGRLLESLAGRHAARVLGSDRAWAMLAEARQRSGSVLLVQSDAQRMPFRAGSLDGVVIFRFLHHLEEPAAQRALQEAARVARRFITLSFFHPYSVHALSRRCKELVAGRARTRFGLHPRRLIAIMGSLGFDLVRMQADAAYRKDLWLASFERRLGG